MLCKAQAIPMHLYAKSSCCVLLFMWSCSLSDCHIPVQNLVQNLLTRSLSGILNSSVSHISLQYITPKTRSIWIHAFIYWGMSCVIQTYGHIIFCQCSSDICPLPLYVIDSVVLFMPCDRYLPIWKPKLIAKQIGSSWKAWKEGFSEILLPV